MKKKSIIIHLIIGIFVLISATVLIFSLVGTKHLEMRTGEYVLKYYGSFSEATKLKIYRNSKKLCTLEISIPADFLDGKPEPYLDDLDLDGRDDLLVPHSTDLDGELRYSAYIYNNEEHAFVAAKALSDAANISVNVEKHVITSLTHMRKEIAPSHDNAPAVYEDSRILSTYEFRNGELIEAERKMITYYHETNYYCYSQYIFNEESQELECMLEDWFDPKELSKYVLE